MIELITSAVQAILQVIVNVAFGVILTKAGYFDSAKQKWLSHVNMIFFTPCLLFSNIASVISFEKLVVFWPIPVLFIVFSLISWLVGQGMLRIFGVNGPNRRFVEACSLFCNTNSLPIAVISSLAFSEAGPLLYWKADDTQDEVAARGVAYTLFYAMFCNIVRWSYGYRLLQRHANDDTELGCTTNINDELINHDKNGDTDSDRHSIAIPYNSNMDDYTISNSSNSSSSSSSNSSSSSSSSSNDTKQGGTSPPCSKPLPFPNESSPLLVRSPASSSSTTLDTSSNPRTITLCHRIYQRLETTAFAIHSYMSPPLYAALLAVVVGLSPLHPLLFDPHAFLYPSVTKAIQNCGKAAVPLILVCLGSQLTLIAQQQHSSSSSSSEHQDAVASRHAVLASLVTRIVTPVLVIGLVMGCLAMLTTVVDLLEDPMFVVAIIILGCTPTAINLSQITQVNGIFEEEMMRVLFWSYTVVCVPVMTMVVFAALALVDKS